ncbi:hypothetical protein NBH00_05095 [Paraconexibacter antarcticus]|uniref:Uncharacterized protein n=1 Tax=Paraconexibacter antarcticus TaxID=2949664 RepID=A0ABY5DU90_9ACTN|nr:hypothetical protein [Paraconexibacter antarcticus]UTI65586.1 hypothetical protein NBH00_05095 [Paraconexibacter antarcticus]
MNSDTTVTISFGGLPMPNGEPTEAEVRLTWDPEAHQGAMVMTAGDFTQVTELGINCECRHDSAEDILKILSRFASAYLTDVAADAGSSPVVHERDRPRAMPRSRRRRNR